MELYVKSNIILLLFFGYLFTFISNYIFTNPKPSQILSFADNYIFTNPKPSQILSIVDIQACIYNGEIEIIDGSFKIYCFSSSNIEEDEYGNFINHQKVYVMNKGGKQYIDSNNKYMIIIGFGYISFNSDSYGTINLNKILSVSLPYDLNHRFYKLEGKGNKLEVSINSEDISVYISNNPIVCNNKCSIDIIGEETINIINLKNAKNKIVKFLYVQRNETYNIDENKGDIIQYLIKQQFKFIISESLGEQYFNLKEGIIEISGDVGVTFENVTNYENKLIDSNKFLYYIQPSAQIFYVILETKDEGEIKVLGREPTLTINFPETMNSEILVTNPPQYVRFIIDESFDDYYSFNFQKDVNWFEGKMFKENGELNYGESLYIINISKDHAGKTFTAIFNSSDSFIAKKAFDWIEINEYEVRRFSLKSGEEIAYVYYVNGISNITFEEGNSGNKAEMFIYPNENRIIYDLASKSYSGYSQSFSSWKELIVGDEKEHYIYLIIKAKEDYLDYISFRTDCLVLNNDISQTYARFYYFNFICFSLDLEEGENVIDILTNAQDNQLTINLYQNENAIKTCNKKACHFRHIQNSGDNNYIIYIKNIENRVERKTKLHILQYRINEYYSFGNIFYTKDFLSSFEYKFKLYNNFLPFINLTKELVINYQPPADSELYNITISSNIQSEFKLITEKISNKIYRHYYYNSLNIDNISEIIFTIKGDISDDLFLPPDKVGLSFGGPFYYKCPGQDVEKRTNSIVGNLIYYRIQASFTKNNYYLSIPEKAKIINGKLFKENGELNNIYIKMKKYITIQKLFNNSDTITIEYNGTEKTDAEMYYEYFNGRAIEIYDYRQLNYYELDFEKDRDINYFGFYNDKVENAYAYIENQDNELIIRNKNLQMTKLNPSNGGSKLESVYFLNKEYDFLSFISFLRMNKTKRDFIIYDPQKTEEKINYLERRKYIIPKNLKKKFNLITTDKQASISKMVIISKFNTTIDLYINSNKHYKLDNTSNYTKVYSIFKGEQFWFDAQTVNDSVIFTGVFEGGIFKRLFLNNYTYINETSENIIFQILSLKNTSEINIEIKNPYKKLVYWKINKILKNITDINDIEKELQKLNLPLLETSKNEQKFGTNNIANIKFKNPSFNWYDRFYNFYFSLSFNQNFEKPIESNYEIKIKYNYRNAPPFIEKNKWTFLSNGVTNKKYTIKNEKKPYLYLFLVNYKADPELIPSIYLQENSGLELYNNYYFHRRFNSRILTNSYADDNIDYEIFFKTKTYNDKNNFCAYFYYYLSDKNALGYDITNYNYILNIRTNDRRISWVNLNNFTYYDIYIFSNESNFEKLDLYNYCNFKSIINKTHPDLQIIRTTNNSYEFPDKTQHLLITVLGFESKYNLEILYEYTHFYYVHTEEHKKSKSLLILPFIGGAIFIIIIILIYHYRKRSKSQNSSLNIAMSDCSNLGVNNDTNDVTKLEDYNSVPNDSTKPINDAPIGFTNPEINNNAQNDDAEAPCCGAVNPYNS